MEPLPCRTRHSSHTPERQGNKTGRPAGERREAGTCVAAGLNSGPVWTGSSRKAFELGVQKDELRKHSMRKGGGKAKQRKRWLVKIPGTGVPAGGPLGSCAKASTPETGGRQEEQKGGEQLRETVQGAPQHSMANLMWEGGKEKLEWPQLRGVQCRPVGCLPKSTISSSRQTPVKGSCTK